MIMYACARTWQQPMQLRWKSDVISRSTCLSALSTQAPRWQVDAPHYVQDIMVPVNPAVFPSPPILAALLGEAKRALFCRQYAAIPTRQQELALNHVSMYNFWVLPIKGKRCTTVRPTATRSMPWWELSWPTMCPEDCTTSMLAPTTTTCWLNWPHCWGWRTCMC